MYKMCKTLQSSGRQREIADSFVHLLRKKAYSDITVNELCSQCGLPRKTFYRYFDSKEDVFDYLADMCFWDYEGYQKENCGEQKRTSLGDMENIFNFWLLHRELLEIVRKNQRTASFMNRIGLNAIREKVGMRLVTFQNNPVQEAAMIFTLSGLFSLIYLWCDGGFLQTPEEMASTAVKLITKPLFRELI